MITKQCDQCQIEKLEDEYYTYPSLKGRKARNICKSCTKANTEAWQAAKGTTLTEYHAKWHRARIAKDPEHNAKRKLRNWEIRLGLPRGWYWTQFEEQKGLCAICGKPETSNGTKIHSQTVKRLAIDHCHEKMVARGLLCMQCNAKLGVLEDEDFVAKAKRYLENYGNR